MITAAGVMGSVTGLLLVGNLADRFGFGAAIGHGRPPGPILVAVLVLTRYPETAQRELEELNPTDAAPAGPTGRARRSVRLIAVTRRWSALLTSALLLVAVACRDAGDSVAPAPAPTAGVSPPSTPAVVPDPSGATRWPLRRRRGGGAHGRGVQPGRQHHTGTYVEQPERTGRAAHLRRARSAGQPAPGGATGAPERVERFR